MTPYATAADRARALYRIPTAPRRNRTLEICHGRDPLLWHGPWPGEGHVACMIGAATPRAAGNGIGSVSTALGAALPVAPHSFDLVILHRTLDDLSELSSAAPKRFDAQDFLLQVAGALAPGGLVAGCVQNRASLPGIVRTAQRAWGIGAAKAAEFHFSPRGLRRMLASAALAEIRIFSLLPHCDAPLKLIDSDATVSRLAFRRELDARRRHLGRAAFALRRLAVELGGYRHLEPSLFFWAYKTC